MRKGRLRIVGLLLAILLMLLMLLLYINKQEGTSSHLLSSTIDFVEVVLLGAIASILYHFRRRGNRSRKNRNQGKPLP
jgi:uncharacterized integral membrane protein